GKTSNMNGLAIAAAELGKSVPEIGLTTFRPPYTPVTFGVYAGAARGLLFEPVRRTPMHALAQAQGAVFEDAGPWKRALAFPRADEDVHAAVARECRAVRSGVGMFDASTLGKIEVAGPDAAAFLDLIYVNDMSKLAPGKCRYGLMLNEQGFVMDDGVVARLAPDRFHVTTTSSGAARVLQHMEDYLQTEFPHLRVWLASTTEQWAVLALQGPKAREVLAPLAPGADLSREALAHMAFRDVAVLGVPGRVFRVSFTGELGFEVNVPADHGPALWEAARAAGEAHGIVAYGTETMHVLRAEKGYVVVGQDTDGTVTPDDLGFGRAIPKAKRDFVGKRSLSRPDMTAPGRPQFVGLLPDDPAAVPDEGAQIVAEATQTPGAKAIGHVTSSYASATLGRSFCLGLVAGGRTRHGETVHLTVATGTSLSTMPARIVDPVFHDKEGKRLDG
ncbi:MAG: sarcosine oxidase subunit alpha, partial [Hyphomicrobiales bacterium]|nr:sarcosine oxidase subunit alpha [Hyphomicrobiales bacterium]